MALLREKWALLNDLPMRDEARTSGPSEFLLNGIRLSARNVSDIQKTVDCWTRFGHWESDVPGWPPFHPNQSRFPALSSTSACAYNTTEPGQLPERSKYGWMTDKSCPEPLGAFDPADFCSSLAAFDRPGILMVGDSLQEHSFISLLASLPGTRSCSISGLLHSCWAIIPCPGRIVPLHFIRNDYLLWYEKDLDAYGNPDTAHPWSRKLSRVGSPFGILIINRGAHYRPTLQVLSELEATFLRLKQVRPDLLVIFRTTSPGHVNCTADAVPVAEQPPIGAIYDWNKFPDQNVAVRKMIADKFPSTFVLDIERPTRMRPDGHRSTIRDCLHYCIPGPLDFWTVGYAGILRLVSRFGRSGR